MFEAVKLALRISGEHFNNEIKGLIEAAKADLQLVGIVVSPTDPLIIRAVITYCKAEFGLDNPDSEKYRQSYQMQRIQLSVANSYISNTGV